MASVIGGIWNVATGCAFQLTAMTAQVGGAARRVKEYMAQRMPSFSLPLVGAAPGGNYTEAELSAVAQAVRAELTGENILKELFHTVTGQVPLALQPTEIVEMKFLLEWLEARAKTEYFWDEGVIKEVFDRLSQETAAAKHRNDLSMHTLETARKYHPEHRVRLATLIQKVGAWDPIIAYLHYLKEKIAPRFLNRSSLLNLSSTLRRLDSAGKKVRALVAGDKQLQPLLKSVEDQMPWEMRIVECTWVEEGIKHLSDQGQKRYFWERGVVSKVFISLKTRMQRVWQGNRAALQLLRKLNPATDANVTYLAKLISAWEPELNTTLMVLVTQLAQQFLEADPLLEIQGAHINGMLTDPGATPHYIDPTWQR